MQIGTRFAEYAVTGAFFLIGQFIILSALHVTGTPLGLPGEIVSFLQQVPALQTSANNFVGALGIMSIFVAGLLLDLFGGYFMFYEMNIFRQHLEKNHEWLKDVIEKNASYSMDDYKEFSLKFGHLFGKEEWEAEFGVLGFWNRQRRKKYIDRYKRAFGRVKLIRPYTRLWSFLSSFVAVLSGSSQLGMFVDEIHLWRTSRAISTTIVIFALEVSLATVVKIKQGPISSLPSLRWIMLIQVVITASLVALSISITRLAYTRMCVTLFSLAYMTNEKLQLQNAPKSAA